MECHDGSETVVADVLGGLALLVPALFGVALTVDSAQCSPHCGLFVGPDSVPTYAAITGAFVSLDVLYFAAAVHGSRKIEECRRAKAQYASAPVEP
jgi:hypothetical protein